MLRISSLSPAVQDHILSGIRFGSGIAEVQDRVLVGPGTRPNGGRPSSSPIVRQDSENKDHNPIASDLAAKDDTKTVVREKTDDPKAPETSNKSEPIREAAA